MIEIPVYIEEVDKKRGYVLLDFPPISKTNEENYSTTVSDAFLWRTDKGYKTKFKYSDILDLFYTLETYLP